MISGIVFNLSMLVALCACSGLVMEKWPRQHRLGLWIQGLLFGCTAMAGMLSPVRMESGVIYDGRSVVLCLAAWYFGWRAALLAGGIAVWVRLWLGGAGAVAGTWVIVGACVVGLVFRCWVQPENRRARLHHVALLGLVTHLLMLLILVTLLRAMDRTYFTHNLAIPVLLIYPLATVLAGRILGDQHAGVRLVEDLRESESRFRRLFEESQATMLLVDPADGSIVEANSSAISFYGWTADELRGMKVFQINKLPKEELQQKIRDAGSKKQNRFSFQHLLANGEIRDVEVYSGPIRQSGRDLLYSIVFDVTERASYERNLQAALQEKEAVLTTAIDGFWIVDESGRILEVNDAYCRMSGHTRDDVLNLRVWELDADEKESDFQRTFREVVENPGVRIERKHRRKDGGTCTLEISARALQVTHGTRICAFFRDVTVEREQNALMRLHSAALAAAANAIVITNEKGRIEWVNEAFIRNTGYCIDEAKGRAPGELLRSGKQDVAFYEKMWSVISKGEVWSGELFNRRKNGEIYPERMTITPLLGPKGQITHYISIKQDLTEQKKLEKMFLRAQRMDSIGTLSSGVAHDLNNILAPIVMSADLLGTELPEGPHQDMARLISDSAQRGAGIIRQLLTFARGGEGEHREVQLRQILRETARVCRETFPRNIRIEEELDAELPLVMADATQLHQVVTNLMINARDAMPEGGVLRLRASIRDVSEEWAKSHPPATAGSFVVFSVADTGCGISEENLEKIFDPFFSTKAAGKGTGLGLFTSLGIMQNHRGFIHVDTQVGRGTCFDVFVPVRGEVSETKTPEKTLKIPHGNGERVLVVDDESSIRFMLQGTLNKLGYEVELAEGGREALLRMESGPNVDLLLLDVMMPDVDGIKVLQVLRDRGSTTPVLLMSGLWPSDGVVGTVLSDYPFLAKPFSIDDLAKSVRHAIRGGRE